jgi:hypothetical protein
MLINVDYRLSANNQLSIRRLTPKTKGYIIRRCSST